jgi:hypothetical protein
MSPRSRRHGGNGPLVENAGRRVAGVERVVGVAPMRPTLEMGCDRVARPARASSTVARRRRSVPNRLAAGARRAGLGRAVSSLRSPPGGAGPCRIVSLLDRTVLVSDVPNRLAAGFDRAVSSRCWFAPGWTAAVPYRLTGRRPSVRVRAESSHRHRVVRGDRGAGIVGHCVVRRCLCRVGSARRWCRHTVRNHAIAHWTEGGTPDRIRSPVRPFAHSPGRPFGPVRRFGTHRCSSRCCRAQGRTRQGGKGREERAGRKRQGETGARRGRARETIRNALRGATGVWGGEWRETIRNARTHDRADR